MNEKENLVLLVGTSPLPNYVVAKYFKDQGRLKQITMLYSETTKQYQGTKEFAYAIENCLNSTGNKIKIEKLPLQDIGDPKQILSDLTSYEEWFLNSTPIHLNYTGGTKTMATQVYNFFQGLMEEKVKFSYLDAKDYKLSIICPKDSQIETSYEPEVSGDLRSYVMIDIDTLLALHNYERSLNVNGKNYDDYKKFNETYLKLEELLKKGQIKSFLNHWRKIRKIKEPEQNLCCVKKYKLAIDNLTIYHKDQFVFIKDFFREIPHQCFSIINSVPDDHKINVANQKELWKPDKGFNNDNLKKRVKPTFDFLDGKWFEYYVYLQLKDEFHELEKEKNFGWSLSAHKRATNKGFELDFYMIKGYQLIGISVTTSDKRDMCKLKGFELIHRVRQIGGEEGVMVLITALENKDKEILMEDLLYETGALKNRFLVFGIRDWQDIGKKIRKEVWDK